MKYWSRSFQLESILPINIELPKAYVLANTAYNTPNYVRTFRNGSDLVVARVTQAQTLSKQVTLQLEAKKKLSSDDIRYFTDKIRFEVGLDEEMTVLKKLSKSDPEFRVILSTIAGFRLFANSEAVETAILTMFSQNTPYFSYLDIMEGFIKKFGTQVPWDKSLYAFPTNETIASLTDEDWKSLNLGYKTKYFSNLGLDELEQIETYAYYPVIERGIDGLLDIPGIGNYTARLLIIYHSRRYKYAFYDSYVQEVLNHKYGFYNIRNITEFDNWIESKWSLDPALVLHALLTEYLPVYIKSHKTFHHPDTEPMSEV